MESLKYLNMTNNKFHGNLPKELVSIKQSLTYLYLDGNRFSGSIPSFIGQLGNLRGLSLSRCGFTGVIPREVGNCVLLESLDLSGNNLTGEIPVEVGGLKNIYECFNLSSNSLNGSIPSAMGGMMMAECIDLSNNKLSGNITDQLSHWLSIKKLNLSFNRFEGILPDTLAQKLVALEEIDVSANGFEGKVPELLLNITAVRFLNFSNNGFYGSITCPLKSFINASFQNNPHLCGNCWGLQPCPHNKSKRKTTIMVCVIVGGIVSFVSIILWRFVLLEWKGPLEGTSEIEFSQPLSFRDLQKATDNLLGEGSYGCVYRGFLNGDDVAVKVFRDYEALTYESFAMECKTLGQVRHRNLLRIQNTCCTLNFKALVSPLMSNGSLANILHTPIDNQRLFYLSTKTRFEILHQLACGISYLHNDCQPPILHCDIKPANVLLDRHMRIHLCDFGLAHLVGQRRIATEAKGKHLRVKGSMESTATATQTRTLALKRTPGYVPPEYGMGSDLSSQGDVYSFGGVVLEMLTRRRPTDPMFREGLTLRSWVEKEMQGNEAERKRWFLSIANEEKIAENYIKTMEEMAKLGLLCTSPEINRRPTMKEVEGYCSQFLTMSQRISEMTEEYEWQKFCEMRESGARQYAVLLFLENQWQKF